MLSPLSHRPQLLDAELLDTLPAHHPDAVASRRDLRVFNRALGNWRWFDVHARAAIPSNALILEVGAGTGELAVQMQRRGLAWHGLDRSPAPRGWSPSHVWHECDIFAFSDWDRYEVVAGNLVFHHFDSTQLAALGERIDRHASTLVFGEIRRGRLQQGLFYLLARAVRANAVSLHDGLVSIRAGFRGDELPRLLGLSPRRWTWHVHQRHPSAYRVIARRL